MPWLDTTCDAQSLPFKDKSFDNIIAMDVLHHIERPIRFFKEVERVLTKNGKLILLEPAITKISWIFYHFFHPEPVDLKGDPLTDAPHDPNRTPFDANQAIPELLFGKFHKAFSNHFPNLLLRHKEYLRRGMGAGTPALHVDFHGRGLQRYSGVAATGVVAPGCNGREGRSEPARGAIREQISPRHHLFQ